MGIGTGVHLLFIEIEICRLWNVQIDNGFDCFQQNKQMIVENRHQAFPKSSDWSH